MQITNVALRDLSPWKGGGFGMFSTIDAPSKRTVEARILTSEGVLLVGESALRTLENRHGAPPEFLVRTMPGGSATHELLGVMLDVRWVVLDGERARPAAASEEGTPALEAQVGVLTMEFDASSSVVSRRVVDVTRIRPPIEASP